MTDREPTRALSIRQPFAELILRGVKKIEYRSVATNLRERVYVYASKTPSDPELYEDAGLDPAAFPTGVLVGTVEIAGCTGEPGDYRWKLRAPERLAEPLVPRARAQPVWFRPFP